jgi:hypothetical protein
LVTCAGGVTSVVSADAGLATTPSELSSITIRAATAARAEKRRIETPFRAVSRQAGRRILVWHVQKLSVLAG